MCQSHLKTGNLLHEKGFVETGVVSRISLIWISNANLFFFFNNFQFFGRFIGLDLYPSSNKYASHADDQLLIFNTNSLPFDGAFTGSF